MTEDIEKLRCEGCDEPAVYEVVDPARVLLCEKCADERRDEDLDQLWDQFGERDYLRMVEEGVDTLWALLKGAEVRSNAPLRMALDSTLDTLERELSRARAACSRVGVGAAPTACELEQQRLMWRLLGGEEPEEK